MSLRPVTVLVSASGAPGTAALLRALRENGERDVRLVGTDMSERSVGRHLCDAFHLVPAGSDPGFADAMLERRRARGRRRRPAAVVVRPRGPRRAPRALPGARARVRPDTIHRSNDKAETYAFLHRIGAPAPDVPAGQRRRRGRRRGARARLPRPRRSASSPCSRPGSRGFRVLDPTVDRAHQLLHERPGLGRDAPRGGRRAAARRGRAGPARDGARDRRRADDRRHRRRRAGRARPPEDPRGDARRARDVLRDARRSRR